MHPRLMQPCTVETCRSLPRLVQPPPDSGAIGSSLPSFCVVSNVSRLTLALALGQDRTRPSCAVFTLSRSRILVASFLRHYNIPYLNIAAKPYHSNRVATHTHTLTFSKSKQTRKRHFPYCTLASSRLSRKALCRLWMALKASEEPW